MLTLFFLYMAVDDGAQLHERLGSTVKAMREGAGGSFDSNIAGTSTLFSPNDLISIFGTAERFGETPYDALRHFSKSLEETIEMAAISILWFLFLRRLSRVGSDLRIRFVLHTSS